MENWIDVGLAPLAALLAGALCFVSFHAFRRLAPGANPRRAILLLVLAAFVLRLASASIFELHAWDERYHAVVATRMMENPLRPMLYADPVRPYRVDSWGDNHVWLHKPPMTMWLMALSMEIFGRNELAVRLPSVLLTSLEPFLTYELVAALLNPFAAWFAAFFHAIHGFLIELASGRAATDHTDALMEFFVLLSIYLGVRSWWPCTAGPRGWAAGFATGLSVLTKWWAGLLSLPVVGLLTVAERGWAAAIRKGIRMALAGAVLIAPWEIYTRITFPAEVRAITAEHLSHFTNDLGTGGGLFTHVRNLPRLYGALVYLAILWFGWDSWRVFRAGDRRRSYERAALWLWFLAPYLIFSVAKAKMSGLVMIASLPLFAMLGGFTAYLWELRPRLARPGPRALAAFAIILLIGAPIQYCLERTKSYRRTEHFPAMGKVLRALGGEVRNLPKVVVFGIPWPIEAMFYTRHSAYADLPAPGELDRVLGEGYRVYLYDGGTPIPADLRRPGVVVWTPPGRDSGR